jgi:hypothetical protein
VEESLLLILKLGKFMSSLQQLILETLQGRVLTESKKKVTIYKDTLVVDVQGIVNLSDRNLTKIPFKFGVVNGSFYCGYNQLTSLEGAPEKVARNFYCNSNQLTSLEGAPKEVGQDFYCNDNKLTNLNGTPKIIVGDFSCAYNQLTSLEGAPKVVANSFYCNDQKSGIEFTEEQVSDVCHVKGYIYI